MSISRRQILQASLGAPLLAQRSPAAQAQALDMARIVIGFPAGGTMDAVSRQVADKMQPEYARSMIVESRVGAGGQVVIQYMKTAPTDGSAILLTPMSILGVYPHTYKKLAYDPLNDLTPVSCGVSYNYGFAVGPAVPASVTTIPQFLEWCKANPGKASFGSGATGSTLHFTGILLGRAGGVELTHVGYRGSAQMLTDLAGGNLTACSSPVGDLLAYQAPGRIRVIGTSGATRSRFLPQVSTFTEYGYKDMAFSEWYGFYLPARTPQAQVQRLNKSLATVLKNPAVAEALAVMGMEPSPTSPAELEAMLKADTARWGKLVSGIGFTADS